MRSLKFSAPGKIPPCEGPRHLPRHSIPTWQHRSVSASAWQADIRPQTGIRRLSQGAALPKSPPKTRRFPFKSRRIPAEPATPAEGLSRRRPGGVIVLTILSRVIKYVRGRRGGTPPPATPLGRGGGEVSVDTGIEQWPGPCDDGGSTDLGDL